MILSLAVLLGGVGVVALWAITAAGRDADQAERMKPRSTDSTVRAPLPDTANPFAAPTSGDDPAPDTRPEVFSSTITVVPTLFLTPLYGCTLAAWNWRQVGDHERARRLLASGMAGLALFIGLGELPLHADVVGPLAGVGMVGILGLAIGALIVLDRDQANLRRLHPDVRTASWAYAALLGFAIYGGFRLLPTLVWIVRGG